MARHPGNSTSSFLMRIIVGIGILIASSTAFGKDIYLDYVSNLYLLESHQIKKPDLIIRYADTEDGPLLKSVLSSSEAIIMLRIYFQRLSSAKPGPNIVQLLMPITLRYQDSFSANPSAYEAEYLDSLEISSFILNEGTSFIKADNASTEITPNLPLKTKELIEKKRELRKYSANLMLDSQHELAKKVRTQIDQRMFSNDRFTIRAMKVAEQLDPEQKVIFYKNMPMAQKIAYGENEYNSNCAVCHRLNGDGITGFAPSLHGSSSLKSMPLTIDILVKGKGNMPAGWDKTLSNAEIAALITYMRAKFDKETGNAVDEAEVQEAFAKAGVPHQ